MRPGHVGTAAPGCPAERSSAAGERALAGQPGAAVSTCWFLTILTIWRTVLRSGWGVFEGGSVRQSSDDLLVRRSAPRGAFEGTTRTLCPSIDLHLGAIPARWTGRLNRFNSRLQVIVIKRVTGVLLHTPSGV